MSENAVPRDLETQLFGALGKVIDPDLGKDIVSLGFVKNLIVKKSLLGDLDISLDIELTTPACPLKDQIKNEAIERLKEVPKVKNVRVNLTAQVRKNETGTGKQIPGVKNLIAVGSGKGGVGKSTVAVNLAFALKKLGAEVGLLDADIHGPSLGMMLNLEGMPEVKDSKIIPKNAYGIPVMTFAFFAPVGDAVIWRGAMTSKAVEQMLFDVNWKSAKESGREKELDYLIVDMPPGTGDVPITLVHSVNVSGAVVVTSPQQLALLDSVKAIAMYQKLKIPVLGIVENILQPANYSESPVKKVAENKSVPYLGSIPFDLDIIKSGDEGSPILLKEPINSAISEAFHKIAQGVAQQMSIAQLSRV